MLVRELIETLKGFDGEAEVHFSYDYGNHWHTAVAPKVRNVEECPTKWSEYHRMPCLADDEDYDDAPRGFDANSIVLS
jgi:hypothetical protein